MPVRTRTTNVTNIVGEDLSYQPDGTLISVTPAFFGPMGTSTCVDVNEPGKGSASFNVAKVRYNYTPVHAVWYQTVGVNKGAIIRQQINYRSTGDNVNIGHLSVTANTISGAQLLARTTPNKPFVDLPVFLYELKDLPEMLHGKLVHPSKMDDYPKVLKKAGEDLIKRYNPKKAKSYTGLAKELADANLAWQFGWKPLISDLLKLVRFQEAYNRRLKEYKHLYNKGGLRRSIKVGSGVATSRVTGVTWHSSSYGISGNETTTTKLQRWAVIRYRPTSLPAEGNTARGAKLIKSLLGLDLSMATIWEMLPWSWLIDWFSDAGNYLALSRNTIPCEPNGAWLMERKDTITTRVVTVRTPFSPSGLVTGGEGSKIATNKLRTPLSISPIPSYLPFLDSNQMSILNSLAISKKKSWGWRG